MVNAVFVCPNLHAGGAERHWSILLPLLAKRRISVKVITLDGGGTFFGHFFACDKHHGMVDIDHAIPWSCDTFYYTLAEKLGIDTIAKYATSLGLSQKTGIDLPDEVTGIMPSTAWKLKTQHEKWYAGEAISVGIGQGAVTVTPLQLARALGGIASGGALKRPHVVFPDEVPPKMAQPKTTQPC